MIDLARSRCEYTFVSPSDIEGKIVKATLECNWLHQPLYAADEDLSRLREILKGAEFGYVGACGYGAKLTIEMDNGETLVLFKGCDSCDTIVFGSYGGYFLGDKQNTEFWQIFGLDPETPIGADPSTELTIITLPDEQYAVVCNAILMDLRTGWWSGLPLTDCTYESGAFECVYSTTSGSIVQLFGYAGYFRFDENKNCVEGWYAPAAISFDSTTLMITDIWWPGDGAYYETDILTHFPAEIAEIVAEPNEERAAAIRARLIESCLEKYDLIFT